jgi:hypothetical protein
MAVPSAPTGVTVPATILWGDGQFPVSWTFVGTGPQTGYGFQWREAGSGTWRGGGVENAGSSASGLFPSNHVTNSGFETDTTGWTGANTAFGAYETSTIARSTERAHSGVASLRATWPSAYRTWCNTTVPGLLVGATYDVSTWVWVPAGSPIPQLTIVFYTPDRGRPGVREAWVQQRLSFVAAVDTHFPGMVAYGTHDGHQVWLDDVLFVERLAPGGYELQVRTRNADGWGPWSATKTFEVGPSVWRREGDEWVPRMRRVRVGDDWTMAKTREIT